MVRTGNNLPTGFNGPVKGWRSLVPAADDSLELPRDCTRWRADSSRTQQYGCIELSAFTESMGPVEQALADLAARLVDGGTMLCDFDNAQSARMLRVVLEGRPGAFDPVGSSADPSQPLLLRRALQAAAGAGLLVRDVLQVATGGEQEFGADVACRLVDNGMLPLDWLQGAPPSRFWLQCEKAASLAGSVLLAGSDALARQRTQQALQAILPDDWEIVAVDVEGECAQWNRAIAAARGDLIWFVRAGMQPSQTAFEQLAARACSGPAAAANCGSRSGAGDIAGTMMPRLDALLVGPLPEHVANTRVALEDYAMRVDGKLPPAWLVDVELQIPESPIENPDSFAADTDAMLRRWSVLDGQADGHQEQARRATDSTPVPVVPPWSGRAPRISLCMIARDEEQFLEECLTCASGAFDELILVDTGSVDRTVEIAESFGAKVVHDPWDDDFSRPRNAGLREATGDWILVLDADEFLQPGAVDRIRELVENPSALGYHMRFINDYGTGKTVGVMMVRLFRNLPGIEYQNVIHEQVTPSLQRIGGEQGLLLLSCEVEVVHHGYSDQVMDQRGKNERNERLFLKQAEQFPDDIYGTYKYGDFLRRVPGRNEDARRTLERCLELILASEPTLPRSLPYAGEVAALCALEAERLGESERARDIIETALRRFVPTPNLHYIAASLALADGRAEAAIQHYRRCMTYRDCVLVVPIQEGITGHVSLTGIAQAWLLRGDRDRARRLLEQAIAIEPAYEVAHLALSRLWFETHDYSRSLSVLTDFLARYPESPGACQQAMLILRRLGQTEAAREIGQHTVRLLEARCLEHEAAAVNEILATM